MQSTIPISHVYNLLNTVTRWQTEFEPRLSAMTEGYLITRWACKDYIMNTFIKFRSTSWNNMKTYSNQTLVLCCLENQQPIPLGVTRFTQWTSIHCLATVCLHTWFAPYKILETTFSVTTNAKWTPVYPLLIDINDDCIPKLVPESDMVNTTHF
jgi:hypothetical protein